MIGPYKNYIVSGLALCIIAVGGYSISMNRKAGMKTVTPREYAKKHGKAYSTVMKWLQAGLVSGAFKDPLPPPFEGHIYRIPEGASPPDLKPGPKPASSQSAVKKRSTKKR